MTTPEAVLLAGERHLIILGQMGNMQVGLHKLVGAMEGGDDMLAVELVSSLNDELAYLQKVYPQMDGGFVAVAAKPVSDPSVPPPVGAYIDDAKPKVRAALRDMRALMDAANASYAHEGTIDCHIKVMLDIAWGNAADAVGLIILDDLPF